MDVALTKMSSKGQIVIPVEMRENIKEGEKLIIIKNENQLIIKKTSLLDENLKQDLEFAKKTEEYYEKYLKNEFISKDSKDFLQELKKW